MRWNAVVATLAGIGVCLSGVYAGGLVLTSTNGSAGSDAVAECQSTPLTAIPDEATYDADLGHYTVDGLTVSGIEEECMDVGYLMYATATDVAGAPVGEYYPQLVTSNPALRFSGGANVSADEVAGISVSIVDASYVPMIIGDPAYDPLDGDEGGTATFTDDLVSPCVVGEDSFSADVDLFNPDAATRNYSVSPSSLVPEDEFDVFDFLTVDITRDPYAGEIGIQTVANDVAVADLETIDLVGKGSAVTHYHFTFTYPCSASPRVDETVPDLVNGSFETPYVGGYMSYVNTGTPGFGWSNSATDYVNVWNNANGQGITTAFGDQFAMLNSPTPGLVYQDVDTSGLSDETLQWALSHSADPNRNADSIRVQIGPPGGPLTDVSGVITDGPAWSTSSGDYTVPDGQNITRFAVQTLDGPTGQYGNFLDDVYFTLKGRIPGSANVQLQVVPAPQPGVPYDVSVAAEPTVASDAAATVSWSAPNEGASAITDYGIQISADGGLNWEDFTDGVDTHTHETLSPLIADASYTFRIRARNASGWGQWSMPTSATRLSTPGPSNAVTATVGSADSVDLYWNAPTAIPGNPVTDYVIRQSTDGGSNWSTIADGTSSATYVEVTGLAPDTSYLYEVTAVNGSGTGTAVQSGLARTSTPDGPGAPSRSVHSSTAVDVWWSAPSTVPGAVVTDYDIQYSANGGSSWNDYGNGTSTSTGIRVSGLSPNTAYLFRVRASNVVGTGEWSEPSTSVTTPAS